MHRFIEPVDAFLNSITMYRLTLYVLTAYIVIAIFLSYLKILAYNPLDIFLNTIIALVVCYVTNWIFAKIFKATTNIESVFITAFILVLIIPVAFPANAVFVAGASFIAMASKYLWAIDKQHIFNPAAVGVAAYALLFPGSAATWWIGTRVMLPFVIIGGFLVMRKIRREEMILFFLGTYYILLSAFAFSRAFSFSSVLIAWQASLFDSAVIFFATIMLTEPLTSPAKVDLQKLYAILVGFFYATPQFRFTDVALSPELALIAGNIYTYIVGPKYRFELTLKEKIKSSADIVTFVFNPVKNFQFIPGQYMEWTLPHKNSDNRGNRRYFSIASSPTEKELMIAVKIPENASTFKKTLSSLSSLQPVIASHLSGDFTLPKDISKPLVFIAGGVGIPPFRSMLTYIVDKGLKTDIVLIYSNRHKDDIAYKDVLEKARKNGVKVVYSLTDKEHLPLGWQGEVGHITAQMIQKNIPDYKNRTFYISGPQLMVNSTKQLLFSMGMPRTQVKTDFFPGY